MLSGLRCHFISESLEALPLFKNLPPGTRRKIAPLLSVRRFLPSEVIFRQGDPGVCDHTPRSYTTHHVPRATHTLLMRATRCRVLCPHMHRLPPTPAVHTADARHVDMC
jgi:hypothetical protein